MELESSLLSVEDENICACMPLCTELNYDPETSWSKWDWKSYFSRERKKIIDQK